MKATFIHRTALIFSMFASAVASAQPATAEQADLTATTAAAAPLVGVYYPRFADYGLPRLRDINPNYNVVYLFAATLDRTKAAGTMQFPALKDNSEGAWTNWVADMQSERAKGRKFILSVGGANEGFKFTDRTFSTNFINSIEKIYNDWGGFDGLDFNNFEAEIGTNTPEMIWVAKELKRRHPGFIISAPPAPWSSADLQFCKDMVAANAIDYCAPQFYDNRDLVKSDYLLSKSNEWVRALGADHVVIGFGVTPTGNATYWSPNGALAALKRVKQANPALRGTFAWQVIDDRAAGYAFAIGARQVMGQ